MDDYSQDSSHITNGLTADIFKTMSSEEKATHRSWARTMLGIYGALLLLGGVAILANHPGVNPGRLVAQASTSPATP
jgi:hypothetical protein